jgi:hypothetical protein
MSTETGEDAGVVGESVHDESAEGTDDEGVAVGEDAVGDAETVDESVDGASTRVAGPDARNGVAVHFENGEVASYAFVVRAEGAEWLYAERLAGDEGDDGVEHTFEDEEIEALNAEQVCRIAAPRVHLFDDGVVHFGDDLVVDPTTLLEDSWFDADATLL